ncbi:MAG: site-specific integrase, partial [Pseudomonadota bacterium]
MAGIETFLEMMAAERGAADNTLAAYRRDLDDYQTFLGSLRPEAATTEDVRAYLSDLAARGFSARTAARRLSALRQFHRFQAEEGLRRDDPTSAIEGPSAPPPLPKTLSVEQVDALLERARAEAVSGDGDTDPTIEDAEPGGSARTQPTSAKHDVATEQTQPAGARQNDAARQVQPAGARQNQPAGARQNRAIRLHALVELLYATGLRVSELVALPRNAARDGAPTILVKGKGGRERLVPIGGPAREAMRLHRSVS